MSNDTIKITVVGTGRMGFFHARLLHRLGFLDSIVEPDSNKADKVGQQFNVPCKRSYCFSTNQYSCGSCFRCGLQIIFSKSAFN